jgi:L-malate glycosyltransferase
MAAARILHLHGSFDLGGKESRAVKLKNHFGDEAHHTVLSANPDALGARHEIDPTIVVEFPGTSAPSLAGMPGLKRYRQLALYMQNFDLVLSYNWGAMDGVMARTLFSTVMKLPPVVHHEDGFNEDEIDRLMPKRNIFRMLALLRSFALVVPSTTLEAIAYSAWHQSARKIHLVRNGIDVARYTLPVEPDAFPGLTKKAGEIIVGTISGLRPVKNLQRLVRAVAAAGPNIRLAIAGEGPDREVILAEAARLGISDRLHMPGFLTDPARYVGLFDIFALSSDSEQYPISLVEAMAAGCPAVTTDVGDIRNMVSLENREFIVAKTDEDALAAAIRTLAGHADLRRNLGTANQKRAIAEYDERIMFNLYRKLYGSAMKRADFARQV